MLFRIKKGLDIPIDGVPEQQVEVRTDRYTSFALLAYEYHGLKPLMKAEVGDRVAQGQELFVHKQWQSIRFLSPVAGEVRAINRGDRRALLSIEIEPQGDDCEHFPVWDAHAIEKASDASVAQALQFVGLWQAFRTRPFSKIPAPNSRPHSIFVTAIDTRPLAADPQVVIARNTTYFEAGLKLISRLTDNPVYLCVAESASIQEAGIANVQRVEFAGAHPAGLVGTHIHLLDPVCDDKKIVWSINYQDVIAIGESFLSGNYSVARVISLAGPSCEKPRLLQVPLGASIHEICRDQIATDNVGIISGSVLEGERVDTNHALAYVGRFHNQITVLPERSHHHQKLLAWIRPGLNLFSITRAFLPNWFGRKPSFSLMQNGSERAIVPIGLYERVLPFDMLATPLLKSLLVMDTEAAQKLGCLELDEEDLALCSYVCPGKHEFGSVLRKNLNQIEKEG